MVNLVLNCSFMLIMVIYMMIPTKHILHMLQQNRYEIDRLKEWMKKQIRTYKLDFIALISSILIILTFFIDNVVIRLIVLAWLLLLHAFVSFVLESKKSQKYIKPLHITTRVIRQAVVMLILNVVWLSLLIWILPMAFWPLTALIATWVNWGLVFVMVIVSEPFENKLKEYYMSLAKKILKDHPAKIIGITGSYGKTSSKNIVQAVLSEEFYSLMTPASFNTPMGITITIRNKLKAVHEVFICEMGADHVGDIEKLMNFINPHYGVVTSIGPQHLQTFKTMENIITEKMKMVEMLPADGVAVLNKDNEFIKAYDIKNSCTKLWYGINEEDVDYRAINIEYTNKGSRFVVVDRENKQVAFETSLLGEHNITNILAAIAIGRTMNIDYPKLQNAVKKMKAVEHRLEMKKINGYNFIDDAFNSNPVGSSMSLDVLKMMEGKRFIVTPGMIDLGEKQEELNKQFGSQMKDKADVVILVGINQTKSIVLGLQESGYNMDNVHVVKTVKEAFNLVYKLATPLDTILLENDLPDAFNN